ncbi:MAG: hypothetical protein A3F69_00440 [Acidobacteria bacterium RIFCSPLOWO2_12_FULL_66_10]|nr:MAG: hypothetical protein A3F69_00440 [Acidobacteria bacterium RIFCSPLOWO2_12_FULL_66_10]
MTITAGGRDSIRRIIKPASPEQQLAGFLVKYDAEIARTIDAARAKMRVRLPDAVEMVYANK